MGKIALTDSLEEAQPAGLDEARALFDELLATQPGAVARPARNVQPVTADVVAPSAEQHDGAPAVGSQVGDAATASEGEPLTAATRVRFERSLGVDLSNVRIHTDPQAARAAASIGARAYALGQDIYFAPGQFDPAGDLLLAHEIAHTVQQSGASPRPQFKLEVSQPGDAAESEADTAASAMMSGAPANVSSAGARVMRWQTASGRPHQENVISDDGFVIQGNNIQVERVWFEQRYKPHRIAENRKIFDALKTTSMPWIGDMPEHEVTRAARGLELDVTFGEGRDLATVPIRNTVMVFAGLPPGTNTMWDFPVAPGARASPTAPLQRVANLYIRSTEFSPTGERQISRQLMTEIMDRLEAAVGATLLPGVRDEAIADGNVTSRGGRPVTRSLMYSHTRAQMVGMFGEGAWALYEQRSNTEGAVATGSEQTGGVTVDPGVSPDDADFVRRMLEEIGGAGRPDADHASLRVDAQLLGALREIDAHPRRAEIIAALHGGGTTPPDPTESPAQRFRRVMNAVDMREEQTRLGVTAEGAARAREFNFPVEGHIVNHTDLLFTGKSAEFSVDVTSTQFPPLMMSVPWVHVHWIVRESASVNSSARQVAEGHTRHMHRSEQPARFDHAFDTTGTYEINALVDHDHFQPNHFTIFVQVTTEDARLRELEGRTYNSGMWGEADAASLEEAHDFDIGADTHDTGRRYEGLMPTTCEPGTPLAGDQLRQQIANARAFRDSGRATDAEMRWVSEYLEQMEGVQREIATQLVDTQTHQLTVQAVYLARGSEGQSQALSLNALAKRENGQWTVQIYDTTQAFDSRNSHFSESHATFRGATEEAFKELCKSYPRGQMSFRCEVLEDTGQSSGRFIAFELDCDSTLEAVRRTAWNPVVQAVVNIAGAAVAIFLPFTAPVIVPTLMAYNAVDTVANVVELANRDAATTTDVALAIGQIAIDVIPYVGQATKLIRIGTVTYRVFEGLQMAGEVVMMSVQMTEQVQSIRMGVMRQAAEVHAQIETLEHTNPSDPTLPALRERFEQLRTQAATAWDGVIAQNATQWVVMRAAMHVVTGIHDAQQAGVAASRTAIDGALHSRGRAAVHPDDVAHLSRVFGVEVRIGDASAGADVKIQYDVHALGGITDVHLVVGPNADLRTVMGHEGALASMRRYEGVTGSLRNVLDRVDAWRHGGGHIPPGTRAFEAHFELQKLPELVRSLRAEITTHPIGSETRGRLESQASSLEQQLRRHGQALDDLSPGLGYVASRDPADPSATMGRAATPEAPAHLSGPPPYPPPGDRTPTVHRRLVAERGSATVPHGGTVPHGWTGAKEANFRYGTIAADTPDGYHWSTDSSGAPIVVRDRELTAAGEPVPRRVFSESQVTENGEPTHFPLMPGDVLRARFVAEGGSVVTGEHTLTGAAAREADGTIRQRGDAVAERNRLDGSVTTIARDLGVEDAELSSANFDATIARLREAHPGDPRIDALVRERGRLTAARDAVVAASERLGHQMAIDYVRSSEPGARLVFGDPTGRGRPGEFDFVYLVEGHPPMRDVIIVVEAKGGAGSLGERRVAGAAVQQGTLPYMQNIATAMMPGALNAGDHALIGALRALQRPGDTTGPVVRYVLVEARIGSDGARQPGRVRTFDITQ